MCAFASVQVKADTLDHFLIEAPSAVTADASFGSVTVTAYNADNAVMTDFVGSIYFSSSDLLAVVPYTISNEYTFVSGDEGSHMFSGFTLSTVGSQNITVIDTADGENASVVITVNPALVAPTVTPTPSTVEQGQTSSLTSTAVSTGTSPYTYQWLQKAPGRFSLTLMAQYSSKIHLPFQAPQLRVHGALNFR